LVDRPHDPVGRVARCEPESAGVEQGITINLGRNDVARDSGVIMHDGNATAGQPVKDAALANVGSAHNGNNWVHGW